MLVGEAWGKDEETLGTPFVGNSGQELNRMLQEAGLMRSECFVTNVVNHRPQDNWLGHWIALNKKSITREHKEWRGMWVKPIVIDGYNQLKAEIAMVQPNVIVAFGNLALHALVEGCIKLAKNGPSGILKWRGSQLRLDTPPVPIQVNVPERPKVIPTVHPAAVLYEFSLRASCINDLRRVKRNVDSRLYNIPKFDFLVRPNFSQVILRLQWLIAELDAGRLSWIELDLETRAGHIACAGLSWSKLEAICIPFMCVENREGYWSTEEEAQIIHLLYQILKHPHVLVRLQNGLYDSQYTYNSWHFVPRTGQDTMISQHAIYSDIPKGLSFQASTYCHDYYVYWKDEGKTWKATVAEDKLWTYNCLDDYYTREVGEVELKILDNYSSPGPDGKIRWPAAKKVHEFQQAMFWPVLKAMQRGLRVNEENSKKLVEEIQEQINVREAFMAQVIGRDVNIDSPKQVMDLFYQELAQPEIRTRPKKGTPAHATCDDEALIKIGTREPLLRPITNCIADRRTLDNFLGNFVLARRSPDGRMRCSFNIGGSESGKTAPKTYRLSSSKDGYGAGANLQTIPSEKSKSVGKWYQRQHYAMIGDPYALPNLRSMFAPDPGYEFFDKDLDRADLHVMAWDADDPLLKAALKQKVDIHLLNVYVLDAKEPPPLEELVESHPKYLDHRGPRKHKREFAKVFCHATDYLGKSRTVAAATGRTVHETERAQRIYLGTYKGIQTWQQAVIDQVKKYRFVENKFGYRWYIFDRIDDQVMPEAVAWIPQSTVSIVINRIWMNLFQGVSEDQWNLSPEHMYKLFCSPRETEVLLQVHDSIAGQYPIHRREYCLRQLQELSNIVIPYDDPLIIPTGVGTSTVSWGEC